MPSSWNFLQRSAAQGHTCASRAVDRVEAMLSNPYIQVIEVTRVLLLEGLALYKSRSDKEYSLTDCISMHVIHREGLTDVLTNDHHFTQEGFHILFPE